jgi:hypothetical protein
MTRIRLLNRIDGETPHGQRNGLQCRNIHEPTPCE